MLETQKAATKRKVKESTSNSCAAYPMMRRYDQSVMYVVEASCDPLEHVDGIVDHGEALYHLWLNVSWRSTLVGNSDGLHVGFRCIAIHQDQDRQNDRHFMIRVCSWSELPAL